MIKNVLLTGGTGFIGRNIKEYLKNKRQIDLRISKQIEREVDEEIERVQKILHDKQNPQLF